MQLGIFTESPVRTVARFTLLKHMTRTVDEGGNAELRRTVVQSYEHDRYEREATQYVVRALLASGSGHMGTLLAKYIS